MSDVQTLLETAFQSAITRAYGPEYADTDPLVRSSADAAFGDWQANVAMSLGK